MEDSEIYAAFLGNRYTSEDAQQYAAWLHANGWDLQRRIGESFYAVRDGHVMTEKEWLQSLDDCFKD